MTTLSKLPPLHATGIILFSLLATSPARAQCLAQTLTPQDSSVFDYFANDVAVGPARALLGATGADGVVTNSGAAYVFRGTPTGLVQEAKLTANDGSALYNFGRSVGLSGSYAFVGATASMLPGKTYVFLRAGTNWAQTQILTPAASSNGDGFGRAIAVDGNRALISAPYDGRVYVYERAFLNWFEVDVIASPNPQGSFGSSMDLVGNRAVLGSPSGGTTPGGNAYVFELLSGSWTQIFELTSSNADANDLFGYSVTLDDTGTIVVLAREGDGVVADTGSAYVFERTSPGTWTEQQHLFDPSADDSDAWGAADLHGDRLLINADIGDKVYVYERAPTSFVQVDQFTATAVGLGLAQNDVGAVIGATAGPAPSAGEAHLYILDGPDCNANGSPDTCDIVATSSTDLDANGIPDECQCASQNFCSTNPNSTGSGATIAIFPGGESITVNNLALGASPVPNEPGIFFYSDTQVQIPFGEGYRCVGGSVYRLNPPSFASGNVLSRVVDMQTTPSGPLASGETWNFQAWYRDPAGGPSGFNLSDGIEITFCP